MRLAPTALLLAACGPRYDWPEASDWSNRGPGIGEVEFTGDALLTRCAVLDGGPEDIDHHNLVGMHDGYLLLPWAPEDGGGGISFFDMSDPCSPLEVGRSFSETMRESHTLAFAQLDGRDLLAVDYIDEGGDIGGIALWDVTDPSAPVWLSELALEGFLYPDSYTRLTLSTFWQGEYLYVGGAFNGVYVVDVSDPLAPVEATRFQLDPPTLVGTIHIVGNKALVSSSGLSRTAVLDLSDPLLPEPIAGADWRTEDETGDELPFYFANWLGRYGVYARNGRGGGPIVYDLADPTAPELVGHAPTEDEGGYAMRQGDTIFLGDSERGRLFSLPDLSPMGELFLPGDLDTVTPIGNLLVASVDERGVEGEGSVVMPWATSPDRQPPRLELVDPPDGATFVPSTARVGLSFDEEIARRSVHEGSVRLMTRRGEPVLVYVNVQEGIVNLTPREPLLAGESYEVQVVAGGVADISGNAVLDETVWIFTVAPSEE